MRKKCVETGRRLGLAAMLLLVGTAAAQNTGPSGDGITPLFFSGNISSCSDIGNLQDGNVSFSIDQSQVSVGTNTYTNPADGYVFTVTLGAGGALAWSVSYQGMPVGIDAVAVKGGNGFNAYIYDPSGQPTETDASSDSGLFPPTGLCGGNQCGLSHMMFCYDYRLLVGKTANPSFTRTWPWTLNKTVSPSSLNLFNGDSGDVTYSVTATKGSPVDSAFAVSGTVTIFNPSPFPATITAINDQLAGSPVTLDCGVTLPYTLPSLQTLACPYNDSVSDGNTRTNVVAVTTSGQVGGGTASATATFTTPTTLVDDQIVVGDSDNAYGPWTFSSSGSVSYGKTFDCSAQGGQATYSYTFPNIVTASNGATANAQVTVNCYSLAVTKTAATSYTRTWSWNINKAYLSPPLTLDTDGDGVNDAFLLSSGETAQLSYVVNVGATSVDSAFSVGGTIMIANNDPTRSANLVGVVDNLAGATVICPSMSVPAGGALTCSYSAGLPNTNAGTNTATATQQNYHYDAGGGATPAGTTPYSGSAPFAFGAPTTVIDNCVNVSDAFNGGAPQSLGTVCADQLPKSFAYTASFTWDANALGVCKRIPVPNVASFTTNTTGATGSSTVTINIQNRCDLTVGKTADALFTRTFPWTLTKTVSPSTLNLFNGDTGDVGYTVTATKGAPVDSDFHVSGAVTISNPWPVAATITALDDKLAGNPVSLNCGVTLPYTLPAQQTLTCPYSTPVADASTRSNIVAVTTSGIILGGTAQATATFGAPTTVISDSISVSDSDSGAGGPWTFSQNGSQSYPKTFDCSGQGSQATFAYTFANTVTASNGLTASAQVAVNCYTIAVSKTANTSFNRAWTWTIAKSYVSPKLTVDTNHDGIADALLLSANQTVNLVYSVSLSATSSDNTQAVNGVIAISNNDPTRSATLLGVIDVVSTSLNMSVSCPSSTVPAGGSLQCSYSGSLPDDTARTNTATATQQNYHYAADGTATPAGSTQRSGSAAVTFGAPAKLVDQCVTLSDAFDGGAPAALGSGTICAPSAGGSWSQSLTYTASFTWDPSLGTCKTIVVPNVASFLTGTTGATGSSTATVNITNQDCALGCTLTQGYWKTHSVYGPAKPDPTWNLIHPNGPNTTFFYSGESWYQAFWTTPAGGNAYWVLAHQYEAAVLNQLNGASQPSQVQSAISQAFGLFNSPTNTPAYIGGLKSNNSLRQEFIGDAAILDMYNSGNYPGGPPHCSEDSTSSSSP